MQVYSGGDAFCDSWNDAYPQQQQQQLQQKRVAVSPPDVDGGLSSTGSMPCFGRDKRQAPSAVDSLHTGELVAEIFEERPDVRLVKISWRNGTRLTWQEALEEMQKPRRSDLNGLLTETLRKHVPFKAFFWECAPVNCKTLGDKAKFEFVVIDAPMLEHGHADPSDFADYISEFQGHCHMKSFKNLGRDTTLIAPTQFTANVEDYKHLAAFIRGGALSRQHDLAWRKLGQVIKDELTTQDVVWVSTDGRGVSWLHFRVCSRPKYYKTGPYIDPCFGR